MENGVDTFPGGPVFDKALSRTMFSPLPIILSLLTMIPFTLFLIFVLLIKILYMMATYLTFVRII